MKNKAGSIIGWTATILVVALTLFSAVMEFIPVTDPAMIAFVERLGVGEIAYALGVTKFILVAIWLWPRTSTVGLVLMVGYYGGALATNITHQFAFAEYAMLVVALVLLAVSGWFRNPELKTRLMTGRA